MSVSYAVTCWPVESWQNSEPPSTNRVDGLPNARNPNDVRGSMFEAPPPVQVLVHAGADWLTVHCVPSVELSMLVPSNVHNAASATTSGADARVLRVVGAQVAPSEEA